MIVMIITWIRYGKSDVSMTLNGTSGGLVAITAGTADVSLWGAIIIGITAGFVIVFGIEFVDRKLMIDDPVGAVGVHGLCGSMGTVMVGILAVDGGLLYGGGTSLILVQLLGVLAIALWTTTTSYVLFKSIKATMGLRVNEEEEVQGLDVGEHATQAYADFMMKL